MAECSLRGMKIGANSLETDEGVAFIERKQVIYAYSSDHEFDMAMATDTEPPTTWKCRCGAEGLLCDEPAIDDKKPAKPQHTHWDMLLERRTKDELEELLRRRLGLLRTGKSRPRRYHG